METRTHLEGTRMLPVEKFKPTESMFILGKQSLNAEVKILRKCPGKNPSAP